MSEEPENNAQSEAEPKPEPAKNPIAKQILQDGGQLDKYVKDSGVGEELFVPGEVRLEEDPVTRGRRKLFVTMHSYLFALATLIVISMDLYYNSVAPAVPNGEEAGDGRIIEIYPDVFVKFRWCPPGTYERGSPADEASRNSGEQLHKVTLSKGFWMAETEFTQEQWNLIMGTNPSENQEVGSEGPVEQVSWEDAERMLKKLNKKGYIPRNLVASLPTEAQWEYACRAGSKTAFYYGKKLESDFANFKVPDSEEANTTVAVKSYLPNGWGLFDMHGNVWEWCRDGYDAYEGDITDPKGPADPVNRILRGGSCQSSPAQCRSAFRNRDYPSGRSKVIGFRLALEQKEPDEPEVEE